MRLACLDLEGVLIPEIWIAVAEATGVEGLRRTTRDEPDYDKLMRYRLDLLATNGLTLSAIQQVIGTLDPMPGAVEMVDWLRTRFPGRDPVGHLLRVRHAVHGQARLPDAALPPTRGARRPHRRVHPCGCPTRSAAVKRFHQLNLRVIGRGQLQQCWARPTAGILFRPPANVIAEFPHYPVVTDYDGLRAAFEQADAAVNPGE